MLHHNYGVPPLHQGIECRKEFLYIMEMESGSRLVKDEQGRPFYRPFAAAVLAQELGQFHPLALSPAQTAAALPQLHIPQPHIIQYLQFLGNLFGITLLLGPKECNGLLHTHIQHLIYALSLILHLQHSRFETLSSTLLACHLNVSHKLHRDSYKSLSQALRTTPSIYIEREMGMPKPVHLGKLLFRVKFPYIIINLKIRNRV